MSSKVYRLSCHRYLGRLHKGFGAVGRITMRSKMTMSTVSDRHNRANLNYGQSIANDLKGLLALRHPPRRPRRLTRVPAVDWDHPLARLATLWHLLLTLRLLQCRADRGSRHETPQHPAPLVLLVIDPTVPEAASLKLPATNWLCNTCDYLNIARRYSGSKSNYSECNGLQGQAV